MNDGYTWGGPENHFYYEIATGAVVGGITKTESGIYHASLDGRRKWFYIDADSARESVELAKKNEIESWQKLYSIPRYKNGDVTKEHEKKWWEIWK